MRNRPRLNDVELILKKHVSQSDLETLVGKGCDRERLLDRLRLVFIVDESWEHLIGGDLESLKKHVAEVRSCAVLIERLHKTRLINHVTNEVKLPRHAPLREGLSLATKLRMYSNELELLPSVFGPKHKTMLDAWKAGICALVILSTGNPHDREVSAVISAMLEEERQRPRLTRPKIRVRRKNPYSGYTEKAHQKWRLENVDLISAVRERLQTSAVQPPPSRPC